MTRTSLFRLALLGLIWGGQAGYAEASAFNVSPTRVMLAPGSTSAVLTLTNDSTHAIRFQLSAFAWDQTEDGRMTLADTKDIVFYPPLVTIEPRQSRRIRVGAVSIACTKGAVTTVGLDAGTNATAGTRRLATSGNFLTYELYQDSNHSTVWGNSGAALYNSGTAPSRAARTFQVYGRLLAGQDVPAGSYTDTITAVVNF